MTRGRKKDPTIPPSRSLVIQRDYRARKAQYVSDLEKRCKAAEEENARLRKELELAKIGGPFLLSAETARASTELMENLNAAAASLTKFQHLASSVPSSLHPPPPKPPGFHSASFPPPAPSSPSPSAEAPSSAFRNHNHINACDQDRSRDFSNLGNKRLITQHHPSRHTPSPSPSLGSNCCGGYMDCSDLVEEEYDAREHDARRTGSEPMMRTSGIRSTSDERPGS